jgi:hypothetical protein
MYMGRDSGDMHITLPDRIPDRRSPAEQAAAAASKPVVPGR